MKVMTVLGTRPEIIRLSRVMALLDQHCEHVLVHTGQNYDPRLNELFFEELGVRDPDHFLGAKGPFGEQAGMILAGVERLFEQLRPDRCLILGDTNSGLSAVVAKRMGIPVYHMEAGNRCYDDRVPEEVNRRIIDHSSDILLPYTERSRQNLLAEGIPGRRVFVTGNPIFEVLGHFDSQIQRSQILDTLNLVPKAYFLVTLHRAENVDEEGRLRTFLGALQALHQAHGLPVVISTHPRTRHRIQAFGLEEKHQGLQFMDPFGFFDFVALERSAKVVLSDSGTVQEECAIFGVPNVTLRDVTERPETLECGSNILSGGHPDSIAGCVRAALSLPTAWAAPHEYQIPYVSEVILKILLSHRHG
jgi:UDP-N-acetylglucosamine 2-epimerase (non-hydrolysing)